MDNQPNKFIAVAYKLYTVADGKQELVEEATADKPFQFLSGFNITLDDFEKAVSGLSKGEKFDFNLTPEKAYGTYSEEHVLDLDKAIFTINNHFDHENIFPGAVVPLQNEDGHRFNGRVLDISENKVKMDLNHPLAGKELRFEGEIIENREATNEEIQNIINNMHGEESCSCGCGHHHHDHKEGEDCSCGHHHHDHKEGEGCNCGHHHHDHKEGEDCNCGHHHHDHDHECHCGHKH